MTSIILCLLVILAAIAIAAHFSPTQPFLFQEASNGLKTQANALPDEAIDIPRLLKAIEYAENTPNHVIGPKGERSKYQITHTVWHMWSTKPHETASSNHLPDIQETTRVAKHHIHHLRSVLNQSEAPDTPYFIALSWTAGLHATLNDAASDRKRDYASRVETIYYSLSPTHAPSAIL
jgi:hypothetical protein